MTDHDRLRVVGIVWGCILATLLVYGCAERPVLGDPDTLTRNWFEQPWPGYETPKITIRDNVPMAQCNARARLAKMGDEYQILCCAHACSKREIEHEEFHALALHNGVADDLHETEVNRTRVRALLRQDDVHLGDAREWLP